MKKQVQQGFTLIELMIVVAIIGILAAVALPAYKDYTIRSKMTEVILAGSSCRTMISEVVQTANSLPGAGNWGCENASASSTFVESIATSDGGVVTIAVQGIDTAVNAGSITLTPYIDANTTVVSNVGQNIFRWVCNSSNTTNLPVKYLPASCRG